MAQPNRTELAAEAVQAVDARGRRHSPAPRNLCWLSASGSPRVECSSRIATATSNETKEDTSRGHLCRPAGLVKRWRVALGDDQVVARLRAGDIPSCWPFRSAEYAHFIDLIIGAAAVQYHCRRPCALRTQLDGWLRLPPKELNFPLHGHTPAIDKSRMVQATHLSRSPTSSIAVGKKIIEVGMMAAASHGRERGRLTR